MAEKTKKAPADRLNVRIDPPLALVRERDKLTGTEIAITDAPTYLAAVTALQRLTEAEKRFTKQFVDSRRPILDAQRRAVQLEKEFLKPLRDRIALVRAAVDAWRVEQRAREEALAKQAREDAEKKAREEREYQLKALESAAKQTPSRIEKQALRTQAAQLKVAPIIARTEAVETTVPKVSGVFDREDWEAEVFDFNALVIAAALPLILDDLRANASTGIADVDGFRDAAIAALDRMALRVGTASVAYLAPNMEELDKVAVKCRADVPVPGVRGKRKVSLVVRSARQGQIGSASGPTGDVL